MSALTVSGPVSAVVITYFTGPVLERCVASLRAASEISEIILIDNGNHPGDVEAAVAETNGVSVRILSGHGNIGFAAACNKGAALASGDILLFLNPDAVMPEGGVSRLLADSSSLQRSWMMGAKLVGPDGLEQQGSRRETLTPWRAFVEAGRLYKLAPNHPYFQRFNLHASDCPSDIVETPTISGACFMLPRADYDTIGGMDESYFLHVEDVDFCLRFTKAGGKIYFNPHVSVVHYKSSSRANPIRIEARKTAGMIRYFKRHFSDTYPAPVLWGVACALWAHFGLLAMRRAMRKAFRLVGLGIRAGAKGVKRAQAISAKRDSR